MEILNNLAKIFEYEFMLRALGAGLVIAIIAPLIGQFLVMRRLSLISDTLAHISLAGATIGFASGINPLLSSILGTSVGALAIEWLRKNDRKINETALALFLFGSLGISSIVASLSGGGAGRIIDFLFGNITTISNNDYYLILFAGLIIILFITLNFRKLFSLYYDEDYAKAMGFNKKIAGFLFVLLASIAISFSLQAVGSLLVGGLMTIPVVTAMRFSRSFLENIIFSCIFSATALISGLLIGFIFNVPTGGLIILILIIMYGTSHLITQKS